MVEADPRMEDLRNIYNIIPDSPSSNKTFECLYITVISINMGILQVLTQDYPLKSSVFGFNLTKKLLASASLTSLLRRIKKRRRN